MIVQSFLNRLMFYHYWNDLYTGNVISFQNIGYANNNKLHPKRGYVIYRTFKSMHYRKNFTYRYQISATYYGFVFFVIDQVSKKAALTTKAPPKIVVNEARSANTRKAKRLP